VGRNEKEKKKKMNGKGMKAIPMLVMLTLMLSVGVSSALASTDFTLDWSGYGTVIGTFNSGDDAIAHMTATGNTFGNLYVKDFDNGGVAPYDVDDTSANMDSHITSGGGSLEFLYTRTDTCEAFYGLPGQVSNSFVASSGTGTLDFCAGSNYAYLQSYTYAATDNINFQATGENFIVQHSLTSSLPANFGALQVVSTGSGGSASVVHSYDLSGYTGDSFTFGAGTGGCVWGTHISATGSGIATVWGHGDDYLKDGTYGQTSEWTMPLGGTFQSQWTYDSGLTVNDYGFFGS